MKGEPMSEYEYWDIDSGAPLSEGDLEQRYDDILDEVFGEVSVGNISWDASRVLQEMDPIAYRCGLNEWLDGELGETITDEEPADGGEE